MMESSIMSNKSNRTNRTNSAQHTPGASQITIDEKQTKMDLISHNIKMLGKLVLKRSFWFHKAMDEIEKFRNMSEEEQRARQFIQLEKTLRSAAKTKYYSSIFDSLPKFDNPFEWLKTIPYLDKQILRKNPGDFVVNSSFTVPAHTSGTTGTPLKLRRDILSIAREQANFFSWYNTAGWKSDNEMIELRGDMVIPINRLEPPYGIRDYVFKKNILSSYHLSDKTIPWYINKIKKTGAEYVSAYPSSAFVIADFMRRNNILPLNLKAVFLASETIFPQQKEIIEKYIGHVLGQYGNAERVAWMTTCSAGCYHENINYGYTEYIPLGDNSYEIVATGFINNSMPLLRYRTGDIAVDPFGRQHRCECGKSGPGCRKIIGRIDDLFITSDGRKIGRLDHVFKGVNNIIAAQIIQYNPGRAEIKIVRESSYTEKDEKYILENFHLRVGENVVVNFNYVDNIPRTHNGKFRSVISMNP